MVAAEAAACGALPLSAALRDGRGHRRSGARASGRAPAALVLRGRPARGGADRHQARHLARTDPARRERPERPGRRGGARYAWESVAEGCHRGGQGRLDDFPVRPTQRIMFPPREPRPEHGQARCLRGAAASPPWRSRWPPAAARRSPTSRTARRCSSSSAAPATLGRAGTQGQTGPDLDAAFQARARGRHEPRDARGHRPRPDRQPAQEQRDAGQAGHRRRTPPTWPPTWPTPRSAGEDPGALASAGLAGATTGEQIFTAAGCGGCHQLSKAGRTATWARASTSWPGGRRAQGRLARGIRPQSMLDPDAVTVEGFQSGVMPSYEGKLTRSRCRRWCSTCSAE